MIDINKSKTSKWKADTIASVAYYNEWFLKYAPESYKKARAHAEILVEDTMEATTTLVTSQ